MSRCLNQEDDQLCSSQTFFPAASNLRPFRSPAPSALKSPSVSLLDVTLTERDLLRASHIIPWTDCESDFQRLDVHNGLLLAAHYDAAFDKGLISFDEDGRLLMKADLSSSLADLLESEKSLGRLTAKHLKNLAWHRANFDFHDCDTI